MGEASKKAGKEAGCPPVTPSRSDGGWARQDEATLLFLYRYR